MEYNKLFIKICFSTVIDIIIVSLLITSNTYHWVMIVVVGLLVGFCVDYIIEKIESIK